MIRKTNRLEETFRACSDALSDFIGTSSKTQEYKQSEEVKAGQKK
jgi:hypothetical protein